MATSRRRPLSDAVTQLIVPQAGGRIPPPDLPPPPPPAPPIWQQGSKPGGAAGFYGGRTGTPVQGTTGRPGIGTVPPPPPPPGTGRPGEPGAPPPGGRPGGPLPPPPGPPPPPPPPGGPPNLFPPTFTSNFAKMWGIENPGYRTLPEYMKMRQTRPVDLSLPGQLEPIFQGVYGPPPWLLPFPELPGEGGGGDGEGDGGDGGGGAAHDDPTGGSEPSGGNTEMGEPGGPGVPSGPGSQFGGGPAGGDSWGGPTESTGQHDPEHGSGGQRDSGESGPGGGPNVNAMSPGMMGMLLGGIASRPGAFAPPPSPLTGARPQFGGRIGGR